LPSKGLKTYKKQSFGSDSPDTKLDFNERFSKESVNKCMNEKDACFLYGRSRTIRKLNRNTGASVSKASFTSDKSLEGAA